MSDGTFYTMSVMRTDRTGKAQHFEFEGYGSLRELMDDIEDEATKRGWFEDAQKAMLPEDRKAKP